MITLASLFDGIGGALLCAERCGAVPMWASEIEPFPIKVTQYHFPNVKHYGDITKINGSEVEPVDIIVGGSPCQDLSVAGLRKGMKHSDFGDEEETRSGLFMEQIRIVKEMRNAGTNQPRFMVWENVPGAFSSASGEDFRAVLEETARIADPSISIPRSPTGWANSGSILGDGFSISWRTVDAQYWGVPQRRRRIYLVADFGGQSAPEILFEREGMSGDSSESSYTRERTSGDAERRVTCAGGGHVPFVLDRASFNQGENALYDPLIEQSDVCPTCISRGPHAVARMTAFGEYCEDGTFSTMKDRDYKDATDLVVANTVRRLTPLECERLQGFPDNYTNIPGASDSARYKALGNSFAIPCAMFVIDGCVEALRKDDPAE